MPKDTSRILRSCRLMASFNCFPDFDFCKRFISRMASQRRTGAMFFRDDGDWTAIMLLDLRLLSSRSKLSGNALAQVLHRAVKTYCFVHCWLSVLETCIE